MDNGAFVAEAINSAEGLSTAAFEERIDATREAAMVYGVSENDLGMEGLVKAQKMHSMSGRALAQSREILRELDKAGKLDTSHELLLNPTLRKEFYEAAEKNEKQRLSSRSFEARKKYTRAIADAANAPVDLDGTVGGDLGLIVSEILRDAELKAEAAARMPGVDYDEAFESELSKATSEFTKQIQRGSGHRYEKNDSGQFFRFRQQIQTPEKDSPAEAYNNSVARITTAMRSAAGKDFQTAVNLAIATFGNEAQIKKAVANFDSTGRVRADIQGAAIELGYDNGVELLRAVAKARGVEMKTTPTVFERRNTVSPKERRFLDALMADNYFNPRSVVLTSDARRRPGFEATTPPPVEAPVAPPSSEGWSRLSRVLRTGEGTLGNEGYTTMFTGTKFTGFEDHPRKLNTSGALTSDAAGAYQFLSTTWDEAKAALNLTDFSPESQELAGRFLVERRGVDPDKPIETKEEFIQVMAKLAPEWASMPIIKDGKSVSYYGGQPAKDIDTLWQIYQEGN